MSFKYNILQILLLVFSTSITVAQPKMLILNNGRLEEYKDTIPPDPKVESFYDSLKMKAYRNGITRKLHNIIVLPTDKTDPDPHTSERTVSSYLPYNDKTIRNIDFVRLSPFGTNLWDTGWIKTNAITKYGNSIHFKTLEKVLKRHLILKEGTNFDPFEAADNERIYRELSYIEDVRIVVEQDSLLSEFVDIKIITKDIWSKAFFLELKELNTGNLGIWDRNIFGTGNSFENYIHWDPEKSSFWGYNAFYKNKNILGSFINSTVFYKNVFETHSYGVQIERKFFTPDIKYAGGFSIMKKSDVEEIWYSKTLQLKEPVEFSTIDSWIGRSFPLNKNKPDKNKRINLILASRLLRNNYTLRPSSVDEHLFYEYHNYKLWLNSLTLTGQSYYRSNLIYSFGRTEDIPNGWLINFNIGKEFSEFTDRPYYSARIANGNFLGNLGYAYASIAVGSFFDTSGKYEQAVTEFKLNYFTNLFVFGRYKFRQFVNFKHTRGIHRFDLERININDENGIRGLHAGGIYGQQKLVWNLESVIFSPSIPYGFRVSFFSFADFAYLGGTYDKIQDMKFYQSYGCGIRLRNERLVFPTIQFRFAYYPGLEQITPVEYFHFSGEKKLNPDDFSSGAPQIIRYK